MKPLSQEAIKRLALANGAKLEINGQRVNTARALVATTAPKPKPAPAAYMPPEPKPAPVQTIEAKPDPAVREAVASIENFAASQFMLNEQLINTVKDMLAKSATQVPADKRPTQWVFKVQRDARGLMESITAKATY